MNFILNLLVLIGLASLVACLILVVARLYIYIRTDWHEMKESDKYLELLEEKLKKFKEADQ